MKKKLLSILTSIAVMLAMMPAMAFAGTIDLCSGNESCSHAASIGSLHYDTLAEAISGAEAGDIVKLLDNVEYSTAKCFDIDKDVALDLNGKTITAVSNGSCSDGGATHFIRVKNGGDLTITDSSADKTGCITATYGANSQLMVVEVMRGGKFTFNSGKIQNDASTNYGSSTVYVRDEGTFILDGGTVSAVKPTKPNRAYAVFNCGSMKMVSGLIVSNDSSTVALTQNSTTALEITGGSIDSANKACISVPQRMALPIISGGDFSGALDVKWVADGAYGVNSGTGSNVGTTVPEAFSACVNQKLYYTGEMGADDAVKALAAGDTLVLKKTPAEVKTSTTFSSGKFTVVLENGATFNPNSITVATGYKVVSTDVNDNTTEYSVVVDENQAQARIGDTYYTTLGNASANAIDGDAITVLTDITGVTSYIGVSKTITIDLNGHRIQGSKNSGYGLPYGPIIKNTGEGKQLTIIDSSREQSGKIENTGTKNAYAIYADKGTVLIRSGEFSGTTGAIIASENASISVTGGTFSSNPTAYVVDGYVATEDEGTWTVGEIPKVAAIGEKKYETLSEAVSAVKDGETIELLDNCKGNGISVIGSSNRTFNIEFNGFSYTVDGLELAGSTGTKSQCFQLLKGSTITMKNGSIVADNPSCSMMIQNYSNLTLENMNIDATTGNNAVDYVLSNNCGNVNIKGDTSIIAKEGKHAFDVYYWPSNGYGEGVNVTVDTSGTITGIVEYGSDNSSDGVAAGMYDKCKLEIKNGTFDGSFSTYDCANNPNIVITGGSFTSNPKAYTGDSAVYHQKDGRYFVGSKPANTSGYNSWEINDVGIYEETYVAPVEPVEPETPEVKDPITNTGDEATGDAATNVDVTDKATTTEEGKTETKVDADLGDKIVDNAVDNKSTEVVVEATTTEGTSVSSEVALPESTIQAISEQTDAALTIKTDSAEVSLDKAAVDAVAAQAGTDDEVRLVVETKENTEDKVVVELKIVTSKGTVSDFNGGNVTVTVPVSKDLADKELVCVYIDDNGIYTKMGGTLNEDGTFTFTTGHFSTYAIMPEAEADAVIATYTKDITEAKVSGITSKTYTGDEITQKLTVTLDGEKLVEGKDADYELEYSKNVSVGTATVKIIGKGKYEGTITKTFKINPKGTSIKSVKGQKKAIKVTWKKQLTKMSKKSITGYQIQYSTTSSFKKGTVKTTTVKFTTKVSRKTISKLKANKKYYVKVRTYKKVSGKNYYSNWSKVKTVRTK